MVQHVHQTLAHPISLMSLARFGQPPLPTSGPGPEAYDQWQIGVYSEAFSATATVWSVAIEQNGRCTLAAQGQLVSHGAWALYAPKHG